MSVIWPPLLAFGLYLVLVQPDQPFPAIVRDRMVRDQTGLLVKQVQRPGIGHEHLFPLGLEQLFLVFPHLDPAVSHAGPSEPRLHGPLLNESCLQPVLDLKLFGWDSLEMGLSVAVK